MIEETYPKITETAQKNILPFPTSYLVECGFSAVTDILTKKRNRLDICERGDLRLKLTKFEPQISNHKVLTETFVLIPSAVAEIEYLS